jgi:ribosomal protein S18 acetylase RimI-like enzyme
MTGPAQLREIERAAVAAWPALETAPLGGWLWRYSRGGSNRATAVACLAPPGRDADEAIREAEHRYHGLGVAARFQVTDCAEPADLGARLAERGYEAHDNCTTLVAPIASQIAMPSDVRITERATDDWLAVYTGTITPDRAAIAPAILKRVPKASGFVSVHRSGVTLSTVLAVVVRDVAIVECVATAAAARRQGAARAAVLGAMAFAAAQGARVAALGALATNAPAQALYRGLGFDLAGRYHIRVKDKPA